MATIVLTKDYQEISSFNITYGTIKTYAKYNSQSIENNQTSVTIQSKFLLASGWVSYSFDSATAKLDGTTKKYTSRTTFSGTTTIQTKTIPLDHNEDGSSPTKKVTTSWSASFGGSGSASGSFKVPDIDRYPILKTAPESFTDEDSPEITYSTALGFEGATVETTIAKEDETLIPNVNYRAVVVANGSYTFNFTNEEKTALQQYVTGSPSKKVKFLLRTTTTSSQVYNSPSLERTLTIANANPTIGTITKLETNPYITPLMGTTASTVVKNASLVKFTIPVNPKKNATISSVVVTHNNTSYTAELENSNYVATIPIVSNTIQVAVIDSRTNVANKTETLTTLEYTPVDIATFSFKRTGPTSPNVNVTMTAKYYQQTFGSTANAAIIKYKLGEGSWVTIPSTSYVYDNSNHTVSINNYTITNIIPYTETGQFTLYIEDKLTTDQDSGINGKVLRGVPTFDAGATDVKINGDLFVADTNGNNAVNVLSAIDNASKDIYSTTEVPIGVWIDGRTIYRQVQYLGDISGENTSGVAINGMVGLVNLWGVGFSSTYNQWYNFPNVHSKLANYYIALLLVNTNTPQVRLGTTLQSQGLKYVAIVIEYTK